MENCWRAQNVSSDSEGALWCVPWLTCTSLNLHFKWELDSFAGSLLMGSTKELLKLSLQCVFSKHTDAEVLKNLVMISMGLRGNGGWNVLISLVSLLLIALLHLRFSCNWDETTSYGSAIVLAPGTGSWCSVPHVAAAGILTERCVCAWLVRCWKLWTVLRKAVGWLFCLFV